MNPIFKWAVIGAGPAGIAAVGKLLDHGIPAQSILWIDPHFGVGDLGLYWSNVSSNTKVKYFNDFLNEVRSFVYQENAKRFKLDTLPLEETCTLKYIVEPLQWISNHLKKKVVAEKTTLHSIYISDRRWFLQTDTQIFQAEHVILAHGANPLNLNYPDVTVIPFEIAIDKEQLSEVINKNETCAVFGSSHSAVIILQHLIELKVKKIINFYRSPMRYAIDMGNWILFDNTGLKGNAAEWARDYIDGRCPKNLLRFNTSEAHVSPLLAECNKVIYAVGFERRRNIVFEQYADIQYNPHVGILGPGLFGLGIAYPELKSDPFGNSELQVGLWKFMVYLNKVLPLWLQYHT